MQLENTSKALRKNSSMSLMLNLAKVIIWANQPRLTFYAGPEGVAKDKEQLLRETAGAVIETLWVNATHTTLASAGAFRRGSTAAYRLGSTAGLALGKGGRSGSVGFVGRLGSLSLRKKDTNVERSAAEAQAQV